MAGANRPLRVTHDGAESDACWQLTSLTCFVDLPDATFVLRLGGSDGSGVRENWIGGTAEAPSAGGNGARGATSVEARIFGFSLGFPT